MPYHMRLLDSVAGAVIGAAAVYYGAKVELDASALIAAGWSPPGLDSA